MGEVSITLFITAWYHWPAFFLAAIIGGMASSFVNNGGKFKIWGRENKDEKNYNMGIMADIIIGVAASIAILSTITPQTYFQFLGMGAIGGYGGSTILRALVNNVEANANLNKANDFEAKANDFEFKAKKIAENESKSNVNFDTYKIGYDIVAKKNENIREYLQETNNMEIILELNSKGFFDIPVFDIRE